MKLVNCKRSGLMPEVTGVAPIVHEGIRMTIPVREMLEAAGSTVERIDTPHGPLYTVTIGKTMPAGIVATTINMSGQIGLRLANEPEYPGEYPDTWLQCQWTPCPVCGAPVVWYEAGYVPGYRVCSQPPHHHSQWM